MNKSETNWANESHYEKAFAFIEEKGLDTQNTYYYKELLESKGLTIYMSDLKDWLKSRGTVLGAGEFQL